MRRRVLALLAAVLATIALAAPAEAGSTTDIIIGAHDGSFVVETVPTATVAAALRQAQERPDVAWAEIDHPFSVAAVAPNDPLFATQWGPPRVRAPEAWDRSTGDASVVVAVVDTGVDATHPDLTGAVLAGADFVGDGKSGDPSGHGTAVAGVVAARGNNGKGIAGYCWSCKILPVRVLDANGSGSSGGIAQGIAWATDQGADIINLSLAGERSSTTLDVAIAAARAKGILVVAAAGNQTAAGQDLTVPQYPAASTGVIGVVATNPLDAPYPWTFRGSWADVAGPGCVLSTWPGNGYKDQCGTSFAAPAVAGILALGMATAPHAPTSALESALNSTAVSLPGDSVKWGRVDADAVVASLAASFPAATHVQPERVAGIDRIATSVALSTKAFDAAGTVVVARSDAYLDALLAAPLAGRLGAPILLSAASGLDPAVRAEVERLGATTAYLVGAPAVLPAAVESGLRNAGIDNIRRIGGADPYATAGAVATQLGGTSAFVAQAGAWPDAVSVSGLAAMTEVPILLVERDAVPASTAKLLADLGVDDVTIIGGTSVVSTAVANALAGPGRTVDRLVGVNRYETSRAVATASVEAGAEAARTWLATGGNWPDAIATGPAVGAQRATLLLVDGSSADVTPSVTSWLQGVDGLQELVVVGGVAAISKPTFDSLTALLG